MKQALSILTVCILSATMAVASPVPFDGNWREQGFLRLWTNDYSFRGSQVDVVSDGTVSLIWRPVDAELRGATNASWRWRVTEGVSATDLTQKGGDDRNLAMYFVFVDAETAKTLNASNARRLLRNKNMRALVYVWGGSHARGDMLPNPYHPALRTMILRGPGEGTFSERVDLAADYRRAFGSDPGVLVGLGVSADSDDTDGRVRASIANLRLE